MMAWAKVKVAAGVLVIVGLIAGTGLVIAQTPSTTGPSTRDGPGAERLAPSRAQAQAAGLPNAELERIQRRLEAVQNLVVEYEATRTYFPPPAEWEKPPGVEPRIGTFKRSEVFRFLNGNAWYDSIISAETLEQARRGGHDDLIRELNSYEGDRAEQLVEHVASPGVLGAIRASRDLLSATAIDVSLGLRGYEAEHWTNAQSLSAAAISHDASGTVHLTISGENGWQHEWVFDPAKGYALVAYNLRVKDGFARVRIENTQFVQENGWALPKAVRMRRYVGSKGKETLIEEHVLNVSRYQLNAPDNTRESYRVVWPKGSRVLDSRTGSNFDVK